MPCSSEAVNPQDTRITGPGVAVARGNDLALILWAWAGGCGAKRSFRDVTTTNDRDVPSTPSPGSACPIVRVVLRYGSVGDSNSAAGQSSRCFQERNPVLSTSTSTSTGGQNAGTEGKFVVPPALFPGVPPTDCKSLLEFAGF